MSQAMRTRQALGRIAGDVWLAPLIVAHVVVRCYGILDPWLRGHRGFSGALTGVIVRNYLRYGYISTRFAPVWASGPLNPDKLAPYYHLRHPSLRYLLLSVSFRIFGTAEWSAVLISVLFSAGSAIVVYFLVKRIWGKWTALLAVAFMVLIPVDAYYGNIASHEPLEMFFALLALLMYRRWLDTPGRGWLIGMLAAMGLGAWAGYDGFYIIGLIGLHYLFTRPWRWATIRFSLGLGVYALLLFGAWVLYASLLLGSPLTFLQGWVLRTGSGEGAQFTYGAWYVLEYMRVRDFFTPILRLLALIWAVFFVRDVLRKRDWARHSYVVLLLLFGLAQVVVFRQGAWVHEYWLMFLTPFFAVAAAVTIGQVGREWFGRRRALIAVLVVIVWAFYAPMAIQQLQAFYQPRDAAEIRLAQELNARTTLNDGILLGFEVLQPNFDYYLDRRIEQVSNVDDFERLTAGGKYRFCVLRAPRAVDDKLVQMLARTYAVRSFQDYLVFDLKGTGERLVRDGLPSDAVREAARQIAPGVELLGYSFPTAVRLNEPPNPNWLQSFLHSSAYEPEPTWRQVDVTLYWRAGSGANGDAKPDVQLIGSDGQKRYRVAPRWAPVLATYSTGLWQPGEIVAAPYRFELSEDDPAGVYRLEIAGQGDADPILLGQVAVERGPAPEEAEQLREGEAWREVTASVGNGAELVGYATDREAYNAGETIELRTAWRSTVSGDGPARGVEAQGLASSACLQEDDYEMCRAIGVVGGTNWSVGQEYVRQVDLPLHPALPGGQYTLTVKVGGESWQSIELGQVEIDQKARVWPLYADGAADFEGDGLLAPGEPLRIKYKLAEPAAARLVVNWTGRAELTRTRIEAYRLDQSGGTEAYLGTREVHRGAPTRSEWTIPKKLAVAGSNLLELRVAKEAGGIHRLGWRGWIEQWLPDLLDESIGPRSGTIQVDALDVERDWAESWPAYLAEIRLNAQRKMWREAARTYQEAVQKGISPGSIEDVIELENVAVAGRLDALKAEADREMEQLIPNRAGVSFGGKVRLEGYDYKRNGERVEVQLYLRALAKMDQDWTIWLHATPVDAATIAALGSQERAAGYATLDQRLETRSWQPGQVVEVRAGAALPPGRYKVTMGLWRWEDGSRLFRDDLPAEHELSLGLMDIK